MALQLHAITGCTCADIARGKQRCQRRTNSLSDKPKQHSPWLPTYPTLLSLHNSQWLSALPSRLPPSRKTSPQRQSILQRPIPTGLGNHPLSTTTSFLPTTLPPTCQEPLPRYLSSQPTAPTTVTGPRMTFVLPPLKRTGTTNALHPPQTMLTGTDYSDRILAMFARATLCTVQLIEEDL